jgi:hypothetical protein
MTGERPTSSDAAIAACCQESRLARVPALLGGAEATELTHMMYHLVARYAPTRLVEVDQTLFGAMIAETPFWGVYDHSRCINPACGRELHVLLIDAQMLQVIDQCVRQLYELVRCDTPDDLVFRPSTDDEKERARTILSRLVFRTGNAPLLTQEPPRDRMPHFWLAEALCIGFAFMVVHETSHQGPQQSLGGDYLAQYLPSVLSDAELVGVTLRPEDVVAWAKEFASDLNAFNIMATAALRAGVREAERAESWYRAFLVGLVLVFKAWDLIIEEKCFGDARYSRRLLRTHPPARLRLDHVLRSALVMQQLGFVAGDATWASRVLDALEDLHR